MIGRLRGVILEKLPPLVLIESQGVGYEVNMPMTCFYELPEAGQETIIHTHLVVREDAWLLFGFTHHLARRLFRELIKVNGVGPKLALAILSGMSAQQFILALENGSVDTLIKLPGVGRKTAERLMVEMKDRLGKMQSDTAFGTIIPNIEGELMNKTQGAEAEAIAALITLGYKPQEANRMINRIIDPTSTPELLIREALRAAL